MPFGGRLDEGWGEGGRVEEGVGEQKLSGISPSPAPLCSLLQGWLDVGRGGPGDELVELYSHLISILPHMAEVLLHHH